MIYKFSIINTPQRPYIKWLRDGVKKAEGRVNTPKFQVIKIGDLISFSDINSKDSIEGIVKFKHEYKDFRSMLIKEGVSNMLPFLMDDQLEEGVKVYEAFPKSERVKIFGCLALGIRVIK